MKKFLSLVLCLFVSFCFIACDKGSGNKNGKELDSQQAMATINQIKTTEANLTAEDMGKLTYTLDMQMDDTTMSAEVRYSKEENYFYCKSTTRNSCLYDEYGELYYVNDYESSIRHYFVDGQGRLLDANSNSSRGRDKNASGGWDDFNSSYKKYDIEAETLQESVDTFKDSMGAELLDLLEEIIGYSAQLMASIEPMVQAGMCNVSVEGMKIEIRSNGAGHIYLLFESDAQGMKMVGEYQNYLLSYTKIEMDYEKMGVTDMGCKKSTMTLRYYVGECEKIYPDLSQYELIG